MESRRAGPRNAAALMFLLLATFAALETAQAQVNCYSERLCQGTLTVVSTIRECCLTSDGVTLAGGLTYDMEGEACQTCVVFGWRNGFSFAASEQGEAYSLVVGYLKGADRAPGNGRLRFDVDDTPGTATEGASNDYRVSNTQNLDVRPTRDAMVLATFRVDSVALEPDETLTLTLIPENTLAMALDSNVFLLETIQLTIQDSDVVTIQFTESDYRAREEDGIVPVVVERNLRIATDVILQIIPVNFTQVNVTGFPFPEDFPDVGQFDPIRPVIATSFPESASDFNISPINITFFSDEVVNSEDIDVPIPIFDDEVNEADEVFVVLLEVVSDVPLAQVNLVFRNASLCRIVDNDPINIGFELPRYNFDEQFITFGTENSPVFLIKENNRTSEQTFEVVVTAGPAQDPGVEDATPLEAASEGNPPDYRVTTPSNFFFEPDESRIPVPFQLFDDMNPELLEGFLLSSSSEGSPSFQSGVNPTTTIAITDNDPLVIGFTRTFTSVSEGIGQLELCLNVTTPTPEVELPANLFVFIELETEDGTAVEIEDYVRIDDSTNPLFDFTDELRFQCFPVTIIDDPRFELTERFNVTAFPDPLSPGDTVVVTPNVSVVEIVDDDVIQIGFTAPDYRVPESVGNAVVNISILNSATVASSITLNVSTMTISGQATDPEDFMSTQSTIVFTEGGPSFMLVDIPIVDDTFVEVPLEEQFRVVIELVDPQSNRINIDPSTSTVTIVDDDNITIGFNPATYTVSESEGSVEVTVDLRAGSLVGITVPVTLSATSLTAQEGLDFSLTTTNLVFSETMASITVPVNIAMDGLVEFTEMFQLNIALADPDFVGRVTLDPDVATVFINDSDMARIGFDPATYNVVEDTGIVNLTARVIEGQLAEEVVVTFSTEDGSAIGLFVTSML